MNDHSMHYLWTLVEWVARNNKDEQDAILEYTYLLKYMNSNRETLIKILGMKEFNNIESIIREHVSDEEQHSQQLTEIYIKLTGIPIAKD